MSAFRMLFCLMGGVALCGCAPLAAVSSVAEKHGGAAVTTPDGSKVVFHRPCGDRLEIVVAKRATGEERVLRSLPWASAGQPAVGSGGAVVWVEIAATNTAYQKGVSRSDEGANLYLWEKGLVRRLTKGRQFDSTPSFGPDGLVYYASADVSGTPAQPGLYRLDPRQAEPRPERIYAGPVKNSAGVSQPVVSPDGKLLVWAEIDGFMNPWRLKLARLADTSRTVCLTPPQMWAYAPRWCPDGRHLVFTGYRDGDAGWCIYVMDLRTGAQNRICRGEDPFVTPDGKALLFTCDGRLAELPWDVTCLPHGESVLREIGLEPERVVLSRATPGRGARIRLPKACSFGREQTFFVRVAFDFDGDRTGYQDAARGVYGESSRGFDLYLGKGVPHFATRDADGGHIRVLASRPFAGRSGVLTGIRSADGLHLFVEEEGGAKAFYSAAFPNGNVSLDHPQEVVVGETFRPSSRVKTLEIGTGWPTNVPRPLSLKEVLE